MLDTALQGVKVLELATFWAGPGAGMHLADHGAEVIKLESPEGDECRRFTDRSDLGKESPSFLVVNRNKRGIAVDLRRPEGREILYRLVRGSDVLIHNFRAGASERLGIRYEDLEPMNPRLIYVHVSPYGPKGPMAERAGYDLLCQAVSGMFYRRLADGTPLGPGIWAIDSSAGMMLAYGVALALLGREKTGRGQRVETSLLQMALAVQHMDLVRIERAPPSGAGQPAPVQLAAPYRCADGEWALISPVSEKQFASLYRVLADPVLQGNPEYAQNLGRAKYADEIRARIAAAIATTPREEWLRLLDAADVPCAPVCSREEVFEQLQVKANDMTVRVTHPTVGAATMTGVPLRLSATPSAIRRPSPTHGQHTLEVLQELGYGDTDVERLRRAGAIPGA